SEDSPREDYGKMARRGSMKVSDDCCGVLGVLNDEPGVWDKLKESQVELALSRTSILKRFGLGAVEVVGFVFFVLVFVFGQGDPVLLDDSFFKASDRIDRGNDDRADQQHDLHAVEVADQFFNTGREREPESGQQRNPGAAAYDRQEGEPQIAE